MEDNKLGSMRPLPLVLSMAFPVMVSMALQAVYNVVDSLFISKYSEIAFAGVSIIQPLLLIVLALANGIAAGEGSLLSKRIGSGDERGAKSAIGSAWTIALVSAFASVVLTIILNKPFVRYFTEDKEAFDAAAIYLGTIALFFPFVFISSLISFILQAHGRARSAMAVQASGAVLNIILDPIFIFALGLGTKGAALASGAGYILSALLALSLYFSLDIRRAFFSFNKGDGDRIMRIALPSMLGQAAGPIVGVVINKLIVAYGVDVMAVYGMYLKMESFMFLAASGIGSALIVIVGYNYGRGDMRRVKECFFTSLALSWSVMIIGFIFFQLFSRSLVSIFTDSIELQELGVTAFRSLSFCFLLTSPNIIMTGLLQGLGLGGKSMKITYFRFFLFLIPLAFILDHLFGISGLWFCYFAADIPTIFLIVGMYRKISRKVLC